MRTAALQDGGHLEENISFETEQVCLCALQYSFRTFQSPRLLRCFLDLRAYNSPLTPTLPADLPVGPGTRLAHSTSELCTSVLCRGHRECLCDTLPPFPRVPTQMSPSQRASVMTVQKINIHLQSLSPAFPSPVFLSSIFPTRSI